MGCPMAVVIASSALRLCVCVVLGVGISFGSDLAAHMDRIILVCGCSGWGCSHVCPSGFSDVTCLVSS